MNEIDFYLEDLKSKFTKINFHKYYLSYSGGMDSHFLYWFIKEYLGNKSIKVVSTNTYMEHQEILKRMREYSDIILYPKLKPLEIKKKYGSPCFSKVQDNVIYYYQKGSRANWVMERINGYDKNGVRWKYALNKSAKKLLIDGNLHLVSNLCCKYLKKEPNRDFEKEIGLKPILGLTGNESIQRKSSVKSCFNKKGTFTPIYDLSKDLENKIYKKFNIPIPKIYNYVNQTGCAGCVYGSCNGDTQIELSLVSDNQYKFLWNLFGESYSVLGIKPFRQLILF